MKIGTPKEVKNHEYRVGMTPAAVHELTGHGHEVFVETGAGEAIGFSDRDYAAAGAQLLDSARAVFDAASLIVKVKELQATERAWLTPDHTLFTYLHLAPDQAQTDDLVNSGATCIAYETVTDSHGRLPLLAPMSEVAGRMAVQAGAWCLEKSMGAGACCSVASPAFPVAGSRSLAGVVGENAIAMAVGLGARVTVLDRSVDALRRLDHRYGNRITTLFSTAHDLEQAVTEADLVVGAVLIPGAATPSWSPATWSGGCRRAASLWMSPLIRAAVSKPPGPPPMPIRHFWRKAWYITAWPICPARWPGPRPWP